MTAGTQTEWKMVTSSGDCSVLTFVTVVDQPQELYEKPKAASVPVSFIKVSEVHTFRTPEARRQLAIETLEFFNRDVMAGK